MRFVVVGTSGAGKSTFAQSLAKQCGRPYIELDSLFWSSNWTPVDPEVFRRRVTEVAEAEAWVVDGNYSAVRPALWSRATDIVWLNFGRATVFSRIIRRTLARALTGQELWAGNKESLSKAFLSKDSILLWSFTTFRKNQTKFTALRQSPEFSHLHWHELRSPAQAKAFLHAHQSDA